jgi:hypothetical protein
VLTLTVTGLLNVVLAITLLMLIMVILQKERPADADNLDRLLLVLFGVCFSSSLIFSGLLVMAGAASGIRIEELTTEALISNGLKLAAIVFGWIKILRTLYHNAKKRKTTKRDIR